MGCDCTGQPFVMKRNTLWNILSVQFPYDLSGFDEIKIDFKNSVDNTVTLSISSLDAPTGSYININEATKTIYPTITATDSLLFVENVLYTFDIALIISGQVVRRTGIFQLIAVNTITTD